MTRWLFTQKLKKEVKVSNKILKLPPLRKTVPSLSVFEGENLVKVVGMKKKIEWCHHEDLNSVNK